MNVRNDKMLGTLHLHKFRGFNDYELADLTRVNLLVGKNNSGKTSILEAAGRTSMNGYGLTSN